MTVEDFSRLVNHALVPTPGTYSIDPVHTFVAFRAQHLVVGRVRGRFSAVAGTVVIADEPAASTVEVQIETASLTTLLAMRDEDLLSARYLDSANYPSITYRSTTVTELPNGSWLVLGDLTIMNATCPVELVVHYKGAVADPFGNARAGFEARGSISRKDFGLTAELAKEAGGLSVAQDVTVEIDAELIRPL